MVMMLVIYVAMLVLTSDPCTRVHRSSLPITYVFRLVGFIGEHWLSMDSKLALLKAQISTTLAAENFFEKTVYGVQLDDNNKEVYKCN